MQLTRTTIRIEPPLKMAAQSKALELNINLQTLFTRALESYLLDLAKKKAKKLVFCAQNLGEPLDALSREDIYAD